MESLWVNESGYVSVIPPILLIGGAVDVIMVCRLLWLVFLHRRFGGFHHSLQECLARDCRHLPHSCGRSGVMTVWYLCWIRSRVEIRGFANVKSGDRLTFSSIFNEKVGIALEVPYEGV